MRGLWVKETSDIHLYEKIMYFFCVACELSRQISMQVVLFPLIHSSQSFLITCWLYGEGSNRHVRIIIIFK